MSSPSAPSSPSSPLSPPPSLRETWGAVRQLDGRFWAPNLVFLLDGAAYFGILNILTLHLGTTLGLGDVLAGGLVSYMTGMLTVCMVFLGSWVDRVGVRRAMTLTILAALVGRVVLVLTPAGGALTLPLTLVALTLMAGGAGLLQTAVYAAVKQATTAQSSAIGFSLIYALMNLGIVLESSVSSLVRERAGTTGVFAMCAAITGVYLLLHLLLFPRDAGQPPAPPAPGATTAALGWREHPLADVRFLFFIFILLGVRTLFAHQWLTMPDYVTRCYPEAVGARYEWISALNPLIIVIGTPLVAIGTPRISVLTMMIIGTSVSALATFLLVPGPDLTLLLAYVLIFSVGEALWSSRFLEYVAELAPPAHVGLYMGVANIPWFLAKFTTGLYSGWMLTRFVPESGPQDSSTLWLVYGVIALSSPLGLLLARPWLRRPAPAAGG